MTAATETETAKFPAAFEPLFRPARYKILYGGRGSGKSHSVAAYLLSTAARKPTRILCCREFQSSIRESVHRLLCDKIEAYRLGDRFEIQDRAIRGHNGSEFIFEGLRHNVSRVRSLEGIDIAWVEEASNVSNASWDVLIPTVRKEGSELIISFNPQLESDATYQRMVVNPPPNATLIKVSYRDNPWLPGVLKDEIADLKRRDPDAYAHVWLGQCRHSLEGAIYAKELREAEEAGRIRAVPYDPSKPVSAVFDLGWSDATSIWLMQSIAGEVRFIDFIEGSQLPLNHYLKELQARPYVYDHLFLPHDARAKSLGTGKSVEELARAAGWRVRLVPALSIDDGINAVRTLWPNFYFDRVKCADGLQALRHYRYDVDEGGQFSRKPLHDSASHAADSLRYCAVALTDKSRATYKQPAKPPPRLFGDRANSSWLGR